MGIKAAYSPKQSIWDGGLEGDGHGHSSWQHPTLEGTRLRVQFVPLLLVRCRSNRLAAAPPARIARIIACSQRPARRMEKLPRRHQKFLGAYRSDCCHVHVILKT